MRKNLFVILAVSAFLICAGAVLRTGAQSKSEAPPFVFEMTAQKYDYAPDIVHVKQGMRVQLKIRATDRTHGFKIRLYPEGSPEKGEPGLQMKDYQKEFKLEQGQERIIEFVAVRPGTYEFKCSVFCGMGHRGMKGKVIVE